MLYIFKKNVKKKKQKINIKVLYFEVIYYFFKWT